MNKINRIVVYGESWRGATPNSIFLALTRLGYNTIIFDYQKFLPYSKSWDNRFLNKIAHILNKFQLEKACLEINRKFTQLIEDYLPDLVIISKGLHILPESLREIKRKGIPVVNWHSDDFFNPLYLMPYSKESFSLYDMHFSSRPHLFEEYRQLGVKNIEYLEVCVDQNCFYPINTFAGKFQCDVSFIGSWSKNRENLLKNLSTFEVHIYGSGWYRSIVRLKGRSNMRFMNKCVYVEDFSRVVSMSKICLNILTVENRDQTNLRCFEIPACKGFQLCNQTPQLQKLFKEGEDIVLYENEKDLVEKIQYFLQHEYKRFKIAENSYNVVMQNHTYDHRCKQLISMVESSL